MDHSWLRRLLDRRVRDGVIRRQLHKWLKAGVWENGQIEYPEDGTPQGGVISPLLSNIYLHEVLDTWFDEVVKPRMKGSVAMVRFADDFVMAFADQEDALRVLEVLPKRFSKYGLTIHPTKTRLIPFRGPRQAKEDEPQNVRLPWIHPLLGPVTAWQMGGLSQDSDESPYRSDYLDIPMVPIESP